MTADALLSSPLLPLISRLGLHHGPSGIPSPRQWNLDSLAGRFVELSSGATSATLTASVSLIREAQLRNEPAAWIATGASTFYPPDVAAAGVDIEALPVVRVTDTRSAVRAGDHLLRSGGFAIVVLDLERHHAIRVSIQSRLAGLAKKHNTVLLCLTRKQTDHPSIGSLVSIRGEATVRKTGFNRFNWEINIIKDKRQGPGWQHAGDCRGPEGHC